MVRETVIYDRVCVLVFKTNIDGVGMMVLGRWHSIPQSELGTKIPKASLL